MTTKILFLALIPILLLMPTNVFAQREIDTTITELNTTSTVIQACKQALTVSHDITNLHECSTFLDEVHAALNQILNNHTDLVNTMLG